MRRIEPIKKNSPRKTEDGEQMGIIRWADHCKQSGIFVGERLLHVPNGGRRNKREAAKLKKMGVRKGVSDLFLAWPNEQYAGLWIELKVPKPFRARVTLEQQKWLKKMRQAGYAACVCYGAEDAIQTIQSYLDGEPINE